jgi:hypothetical protein
MKDYDKAVDERLIQLEALHKKEQGIIMVKWRGKIFSNATGIIHEAIEIMCRDQRQLGVSYKEEIEKLSRVIKYLKEQHD